MQVVRAIVLQTTGPLPFYSLGQTIAITASPKMHVNLGHLFSLLGPEELNYSFIQTYACSNPKLPEVRR